MIKKTAITLALLLCTGAQLHTQEATQQESGQTETITVEELSHKAQLVAQAIGQTTAYLQAQRHLASKQGLIAAITLVVTLQKQFAAILKKINDGDSPEHHELRKSMLTFLNSDVYQEWSAEIQKLFDLLKEHDQHNNS